jgi:hypothetical protein
MAAKYNRIDRDVQVSEVTTAKRRVLYEVGTAEVQGTVQVRKAGGSLAASSSSATAIAGNVFEMTIVAADLDTEGELLLVSWGATDSNYVFGIKVVDHDPFDAIAEILADTGTDGVALANSAINSGRFATGAITAAAIAADAFAGAAFAANFLAPEAFSGHVWHIGREVQLSEATTALRTIMFPMGTAETLTVKVTKGGAALATSGSVASQVANNLGKLVIAAADIDTLGEVAFELAGVTNTQYISGITVVRHRPHDDLNLVARRNGRGLIREDSATDTIATYDGPTSASAVLQTETRSTDGTYTYWAPSNP